MKVKCLVILCLMMFICGCQKVQDKDISAITDKLASEIKKSNTYRSGYKYYLPTNMSIKEYSLYNDVINSEEGLFYLYVDIISFKDKSKNTYVVNEDAYYSALLEMDNKVGYIEINLQENDQYLIEIMFNYAKIEVMVDYDNINLALSHAVSILRSVEYNDSVIASLLGDSILNFQEEVYNIFNTTSSDSNYLKYVEEDELKEKEQEEEIKDTDLIN
ncbi:MAG: hypothetical protein E7164_00795 [Firmicutes bacterium]|nr:hypothetical protein [Bacillota bacterium]